MPSSICFVRRLLAFSLFAAAVACWAGSAHAGIYWWDPTGAANGGTDGGGDWLSAGLWWDNTASTYQTWSSGNDAVFGFGGTGGAVTLGSPTTVNSLTFNAFTDTYTLGTAGQAITLKTGIAISAGAGAVTIISPVTLGAAQSWLNNSSSLLTVGTDPVNNASYLLTVGGSGNTTISSVIGGAGGLTKTGAGTLTLSGASAYTGNTIVSAGTIQLNGSYAVAGTGTTSQLLIGSGSGTNGTVIVGSGAGVLTFGGDGYGNAAQVGLNGGTGALTINDGTTNIAGTAGATTAAALNIGVQTATGAGTGTVTVNNGILNVGSRILMGANNASSSGTLTINGGAVNVGYNGPLGYTGNDPGNILMGTGTAKVNLNGGTLSVYGFMSSTGTATINFNGGTLVALGSPTYFLGNNGGAGNAPTAVGAFTTNVRAGGAIINTNSFNITIPTALVFDPASTGGGVTKSGAGTLTLSGANTYTGATTISAGTLQIGGAGKLGNGTYAGAISNAGTLQYSSSSAQTLSGNITGSGSLIKDTATGTLVLSGTNTYAGTTTVNAGTLQYDNFSAVGNTSKIVVGSGGTALFHWGGATTISMPIDINGAGAGGSGALRTYAEGGQITVQLAQECAGG